MVSCFIPKFPTIIKFTPTSWCDKNQNERSNRTHGRSPKWHKLNWTHEHQKVFDLLKTHLTSVVVLNYPDFGFPFSLKTDSSLYGLALFYPKRTSMVTVVLYPNPVNPCLPNKQLMHNYSSAKLELLALKWTVTEKLRDYLYGSKFTIFTDNNPLIYVKESKLRVVQIRWLKKLTLFNCDIKYWTNKLNRAADAIRHHRVTNDDKLSDAES